MSGYPLTRLGTIGPLADEVERCGGSPARVFARADLPLRLLDRPDALVLLRDQVRLVEFSAREIGDDALPARLSLTCGVGGLGALGRLFTTFSDLGSALRAASWMTPLLVQAATRSEVMVDGRWATFSYRVTDPLVVGRQKNELLALGYLIGLVREFAGPTWVPDHAFVTGSMLPGRRATETAFSCDLALGHVAAIVFPVELLDLTAPPGRDPRMIHPIVPEPEDLLGCVRHVVRAEMEHARPGIDRVAGRLGLSRRTLQRRCAEQGRVYQDILTDVLVEEAQTRLAGGRSITAIALELGYKDPAHFSRAFRTVTGCSPRQWRSERHSSLSRQRPPRR